MDFRMFSAGLRTYGSSERQSDSVLLSHQFDRDKELVPNVNFASQEFEFIKGSQNYEKIEALMLNLALNHSVLPT